MTHVAFGSLKDGATFIYKNELWRKEVLSQSNKNARPENSYNKSARVHFDAAFLVQPCATTQWKTLRKARQEELSTKVVTLKRSRRRLLMAKTDEKIVQFKDLQSGDRFRFPGDNLLWIDSFPFEKTELFANRFRDEFNALWTPDLEILVLCGTYRTNINPDRRVVRL